MNKTLIFFASAALLIAAGLYNANTANHEYIPAPVQEVFQQWKAQHGKVYANPSEHNFRLKVFFQNFLRVKAESLTATTYTVALNQFSDLTKEEFLTKYTGVVFDKTERVPSVDPLSQGPPPASVNWVAAGKVNAIKNQGQCGSCWAFSVINTVETSYAITKGTLYNLSEQQLVDCAGPYGPQGCNGGWMNDALNYVIAKGSEQGSDYQYTAVQGTCQYDANKVKVRITSLFTVKPLSYSDVLQAAATTSVTLAADAYGFMNYQSGVFNGQCGTQMNHAINIVGYGVDSASGQKYWLMRNSWGSSWGEQGYFRMIKVEQDGMGWCGMYQRPYYPIV